jgi:TolA-binding protein
VADTDNRVDTLEAQIADLQAAQHNITLHLTEIRQELQGGVSPAAAQPGEPAPDLRALQSEIGALGEQLLTLTEQVAALSALLADLQAQVQQQAEHQPAEQDLSPAPSVDSAMFDAAFADYMAAEYVLAVDGFEEYLRRFPTTEKADEALYWTGESLAGQERHSEARGRFLRVILEYPESEMVAGARLRAALEAIEIGQPEAAIQELRSVVNYHPGTDALLVACMQLERMQEQLPDGCPR